MDVRKIHSYISLLISVQLLLWTVSGLYFSFNKIEKIRGEHYYRALDKGNTSSDYDTVEMISKSNAFSIILEKTFLIPLELEVISELKKGSEYRGRELPIYKVTAKNIEDSPYKYLSKSLFRRNFSNKIPILENLGFYVGYSYNGLG